MTSLALTRASVVAESGRLRDAFATGAFFGIVGTAAVGGALSVWGRRARGPAAAWWASGITGIVAVAVAHWGQQQIERIQQDAYLAGQVAGLDGDGSADPQTHTTDSAS